MPKWLLFFTPTNPIPLSASLIASSMAKRATGMAHAVVAVDDGGIPSSLHYPDIRVSVERADPEPLDIMGNPNNPVRMKTEELRRSDRIGDDPGMRLTQSRRRQYPLDKPFQLPGIDARHYSLP